MKKTLIFVCIAVLLLGGGIFGSWYVLTHKQSERIARIYQQDKLLYEIDLSTVQKAYTITIDGENGAENVVLVEPGQISMQSASCPDHLRAPRRGGPRRAHRLPAESHPHFHCI